MKKQTLCILVVTCFISIPFIWYSCQMVSDTFEQVEVSFNIHSKSISDIKSSSILKSKAYDLNDADKVIITVQEDNGSPTDYTQFELNVHKMGDTFITKKIVLPFGDYMITEFYVIDALDSIIYASPLEGSLMAQNVNDPLPVLFNITEKKSKAVDVEVISTENLKPEDFGLVRFPILAVETFQFLINVSELGTDIVLMADLTITSGSYTYSQELDSIIDNIVTIKDGYIDYILTIESLGHEPYSENLTNAELKQYDSIPLVVELEKLTVTDYDGNIYQTVTIGNQVWIAKNLITSTYNSGIPIANVTDNTEWINLTTGAYCWYNNDSATFENLYGKLYNWYTVETGNLCPTGWHVPTDAEWKQLEMYLGMSNSEVDETSSRGTNEGSKLAGSANLWNNGILENDAEFGTSGFNAFPGGYRTYDARFVHLGNEIGFWSATGANNSKAWGRALNYNNSGVYRYDYPKNYGFYVRCVKD